MQQAILAQIDLPDILKYSSKKVIAEVFEEAPDELKPPENTLDYVDDRVNIIRRKWGLKPILPKRRR